MKIQTQVLSLMPFRGGLATAGKQSSIGEDQLWVAENAMPGLDGIISSRPGLVQHGQTLTSPSSSASNSFQDLFDYISLIPFFKFFKFISFFFESLSSHYSICIFFSKLNSRLVNWIYV